MVYTNSAANSTFGSACAVGLDIHEIWPAYSLRDETAVEDLRIPEKVESIFGIVSTTAIPDNQVMILIRLEGSKPLMLEPQNGYGSQVWLQEKLDLLVSMVHRVSSLESLSDICRETVAFTLDNLDIDRIGILMINKETRTIRGTWGTDPEGKLVDESEYESHTIYDDWVNDALSSTAHSVFHDNFMLRNYGKVVGQGWNAKVNLWRGNAIIGWLAADNLLLHRPLTPSVKELLRQLGALLSQILSSAEAEWAAARHREDLERIVAEKTEKLDKQYRNSIVVNRRLRDREAMENMGEAIAGVAHELNTPIGNGVTAASGIAVQTNTVRKDFNAGELSSDCFNEYLDYVDEAARILGINLKHAADLVGAFRKTAVDQASDRLVGINLRQFLDTIVLSQGHLLKRLKVGVDISVPGDLEIQSYPGRLSQVLINLVANSLKHGFDTRSPGNQISVEVQKSPDGIIFRYRDNGKGIAPEAMEHLFESFYTTARDDGGSGLGLYIVRDIVENQLGGSVSVNSEPGEFTQFEITLPLAVPPS